MAENIAYAAGLFEGEGWISRQDTYRKKGGELAQRTTPLYSIAINMTDREPLELFQQVFGGKIYGPYTHDKRPNRKPIYRYHLAGKDQVQSAAKEMYPWLSPRRRGQIDSALSKREAT